MKTTFKILSAISVLAFLSACAENGFDNANWDTNAASQIDDRIAESAARSNDATTTLAQIERTRTAPTESMITTAQLDTLPPELRRPTTIEWSGPAVDLASEMARNIGYTFAVTGDVPPVPIMVAVSSVNEPAVKVFENIGFQVAQFAEVFVDPNGKRIEFRYNSDGRAAAGAPNLNGNGAPKGVRSGRTSLGK